MGAQCELWHPGECNFHHLGRCKRGEECFYLHSTTTPELKQAAEKFVEELDAKQAAKGNAGGKGRGRKGKQPNWENPQAALQPTPQATAVAPPANALPPGVDPWNPFAQQAQMLAQQQMQMQQGMQPLNKAGVPS